MVIVIGVLGGRPPPNALMWNVGNSPLNDPPRLSPVASVNSSIRPTPGAVTLTSADALASTLMKVLTSKALPPQVPASEFCWLARVMAGDLAVAPACCAITADWVPAGWASAATVHVSMRAQSQALTAAATS